MSECARDCSYGVLFTVQLATIFPTSGELLVGSVCFGEVHHRWSMKVGGLSWRIMGISCGGLS